MKVTEISALKMLCFPVQVVGDTPTNKTEENVVCLRLVHMWT
jgi:hypothetical protein